MSDKQYAAMACTNTASVALRKQVHVMKTPLHPTFIKNWGLQGYVFLLQNIDCGYSLEPPPVGGSNEYPQSML